MNEDNNNVSVPLTNEILPTDSIVMSSKSISPLWSYFEKKESSNMCKICTKQFSKKTSTSILRMHLEIKHSKEYKLAYGVSPNHGPIENWIKTKKSPLNDKQKRALVKWAVSTFQPFLCVDDDSFVELIESINSLIKVPCRQTLKSWIDQYFQCGKEIVKHKLEEVEYISITTDIWTSAANESYCSLVAHYIDDNWDYHCIALDCCFIQTPHTDDQIYKWLKEALQDWNISRKVISVTTDCASNNISALKMLNSSIDSFFNKVLHVRCVAHCINLVVKEGLDEVETLLGYLRVISSLLKNSPKQWESFQKIAKDINCNVRKMILDSPTRWSSTYEMIQRAIDNK